MDTTTDSSIVKVSQDTSIQCDLLSDGQRPYLPGFDITNASTRRKLVRRCYALLIVQIACALPGVALLLLYPLPDIKGIEAIVTTINLSIYAALYVFREWRRTAPFNYLVLLLTTITSVFFRSLHLMHLPGRQWVIIYPLALIVELLALIAYSKLERFRFTNRHGAALIGGIFGILLMFSYFANYLLELLTIGGCVFEAWYIIYDTHLMLTGRHKYNVKADEYVFAACNIHVDVAKLAWDLFRDTFLAAFTGVSTLCFKNCKDEFC